MEHLCFQTYDVVLSVHRLHIRCQCVSTIVIVYKADIRHKYLY